jgi:hypothetical protein
LGNWAALKQSGAAFSVLKWAEPASRLVTERNNFKPQRLSQRPQSSNCVEEPSELHKIMFNYPYSMKYESLSVLGKISNKDQINGHGSWIMM